MRKALATIAATLLVAAVICTAAYPAHAEAAWPKKYTGVGLKADSNEVAVEGITLCNDGFEIGL